MKKRTFLYSILLLLMVSDLCLGKDAGDTGVTTLGEIRMLVDISQDLSDTATVAVNTQVQKNSETGAISPCVCRENQWSCTDTNSKLHGKECVMEITQNER